MYTSSALGAMPPSFMQMFVNYSYYIDSLLKEINVTLNLKHDTHQHTYICLYRAHMYMYINLIHSIHVHTHTDTHTHTHTQIHVHRHTFM